MSDDAVLLTGHRCTVAGHAAFAGAHAWRRLGPAHAYLNAAQTVATSYDWCAACGNVREINRRHPSLYLLSQDYWERPPADVLAIMTAHAGLRFDDDSAESRRCTAGDDEGQHFWRRIGARKWMLNGTRDRAEQFAVCDCGTIAHVVIAWPEFGVLIADWDAFPVSDQERRHFASQCAPEGHVWQELAIRTSTLFGYRRCGCGAVEETPMGRAPVLLVDGGQR